VLDGCLSALKQPSWQRFRHCFLVHIFGDVSLSCGYLNESCLQNLVSYSFGYNSIHYIYVPEIMSQEVRAIGTAFAVEVNVLINIVLNQVSPIAFANIGWRYYLVFIVTNLISAVVVFLYFPETKGKTLEEISKLFGDELIIDMNDITMVGKSDVEAAMASHKE
jgi:hypothetical protein